MRSEAIFWVATRNMGHIASRSAEFGTLPATPSTQPHQAPAATGAAPKNAEWSTARLRCRPRTANCLHTTAASA